MGLFSILKKVVGAVAPVVGTALGGPLGGALGSAASGLLAGSSNNHALGDANAATQLGLTNAENALNTQFGHTTDNFMPWITGGQKAFGQEGDILGLNGGGAQSAALSGIQTSPLFQSIFNTGKNSVLASASATGGLRGGNVNDALAQNGENAFASTVQNLLSQLGGLSGQGLSAAGTLGGLGAQNANSIADLLVGSGKANAGTLLGQQAVDNNTQSGLDTAFGGQGIQDQLKKLLQGITGGGGGNIFSGSGSGQGANGGSLPNFPSIQTNLPSIAF